MNILDLTTIYATPTRIYVNANHIISLAQHDSYTTVVTVGHSKNGGALEYNVKETADAIASRMRL